MDDYELIRKMAEFIAKRDIDEDICKKVDCKIEVERFYKPKERDNLCINCVIEYFEKLK